MRKTFTGAAAALALTMLIGVAAQAEPFAVTMPAGYGEFTKQVQTAKSPEGDIETTNWIAKAPTGEAVVITMSKMPGKILDSAKLVSSTRDSLLKSLGATIENDAASDVTFQGSGAFFRAHFEAKEDRFYQLLYVGRSAEQRTAAAVGQMFESFKITE